MIRKVALPALLAIFVAALMILIRSAIKDPASLATLLSGMISALSGVTTIVLAYWLFQRERGNRRRDEIDQGASKAESQKRLAASCGATINEWLNRRDLNDIVRRAGTIPGHDYIEAQLHLLAVARRGASYPQGAQRYWQREIQLLEHVLQVSAFEALPQAPNIWTDGLNRESFQRLPSDAAEQLGTLGTIWANLVLISTELSPAIDRIDQLRADEADLLPTVAYAIQRRVIEFRSQLEAFLELASATAEHLRNNAGQVLDRDTTLARELLNKTRVPSRWFEDAWAVINFSRLHGPIQDVSNYARGQVAELAAGAERLEQKHEQLIESLKNSTQERKATEPSA